MDTPSIHSLGRRATTRSQVATPLSRVEASGDGLTARRLAFERLTDQRLLRAYRLATLVLRDAGEAEDAVHDAAVLAWTRFDELRDRSLFDAWFDRIVVNACRQRLRQRRIRPVATAVTPDVPLGDGASRRAERDVLRRALDRLTPEHRLVVVLRHLEGYSTTEIAARTGEREGTVKSRLHYALRELRAAYDAAERGTEGQG
jgi:RNA polymerase sigma-70 factor (ECF subfamily)